MRQDERKRLAELLQSKLDKAQHLTEMADQEKDPYQKKRHLDVAASLLEDAEKLAEIAGE